MQRRHLFTALFVAMTLAFLAGQAFTEDDAPAEDPMMKLMMELGTPGEHHKGLEPMIGDWDVEAKMWMGPGDPIVTQGSCTNSWFLGGRFVRTEYHGSWMDKPFEGGALLGYNNFKKRYEGIWVDSMSTNIHHQTGSREGNAITLQAVWEGPMGTFDERMVMTFVDADTLTMASYMSQKGAESSMHMQLTYTRRKPAASAPAPAPGVRGACRPAPKGPGY